VILYAAGALLIGVGAAIIYEAGRQDEKREGINGTWELGTDNPDLGPMADVRIVGNRVNPAGNPA
jgi:hypothetical protein